MPIRTKVSFASPIFLDVLYLPLHRCPLGVAANKIGAIEQADAIGEIGFHLYEFAFVLNRGKYVEQVLRNAAQRR